MPVGKTNPVVQLAHAIAGRGRCLVILDRRPDRSVQCPERPRKTLSLSRRPRAGAVLPRTGARTGTSRGPSALGRRRVGEARPCLERTGTTRRGARTSRRITGHRAGTEKPTWEGGVRCNLRRLDHAPGRMADASTNLAVGFEVARALGHARLESVVLCNIGIVQKALGRAARAARCCSGRPGRGREPAAGKVRPRQPGHRAALPGRNRPPHRAARGSPREAPWRHVHGARAERTRQLRVRHGTRQSARSAEARFARLNLRRVAAPDVTCS